jgi:hypothetical protein
MIMKIVHHKVVIINPIVEPINRGRAEKPYLNLKKG